MVTMEELLASQTKKLITAFRNQQVEGEVVSITDKEITLDIGAKSEGVLQKKELSKLQIEDLKVGDKLTAFVSQLESESGQVILSINKQIGPTAFSFNKKWDKFIQAQNQKRSLRGSGVEVNKGGVIIEVDGTHGFLPISQVIYTKTSDLESLIGQELSVQVIEVDPQNNRLIFTQRKEISKALLDKLSEFSVGQKITGRVVAVLPFGIYLEVGGVLGVEGLVRAFDLNKLYQIDQSVEAEILNIDKNLGRLNLSIESSQRYKVDDIVKGTVLKVANIGVFVSLDDGTSGLMHISKLEPGALYQEGQKVTCLVDGIDLERRRINLAPFITSTKGLIYK